MFSDENDDLPPPAELFTLKQLSERHPNLLPPTRLRWAARNRHHNGLTCAGALFDSPCGELVAHEPTFLRWFLGLTGRHKPRASNRGSSRGRVA